MNFHSWKRAEPYVPWEKLISLQWSHEFSFMEINERGGDKNGFQEASMEP